MASRSGPTVLRQAQLLATSMRSCNPRAFSRAALSHPSIRSQRPLSPIISSLPHFAPFSTSSPKKILPPGPQVIDGGVNDPAPVPKPSPIHGSYHWTFERLIALGLVPLTIAPFVGGSLNPTLDAVFVAAIIIHSHIGFQACIIDYFPVRQHATLRKGADWLLNICTVLVAVAFYEFETNDVGVTEAIKRIWRAGRDPKKELTA